jgi:hypothetical protein
MNTYPIDITVYADSQKNTVLHKETTYAAFEIIQRISHSDSEFIDDDKWWERIVFGIENIFADNWYCIEVVTSDGKFGRILERDYCVLGLDAKNEFVWMNKLFLFGKTRWANISETFSGSLIFSYEITNIQSDRYYRYGSDENVISMIKGIADSELFDCKFVDVVINPSSNSILAMNLIHHYEFIISVPTKKKVARLNEIYQSITICKDAFSELSNQINLIQLNKLSDQNFLNKALYEIKILLDGQSQHSFFATLKKEFKPDL